MAAIQMTLAASLASVAASTVRCGERNCSLSEYCSEGSFCNSCEDICLPSNHNYDKLTCQTKCSEYLNNLYVHREELNDAVSRLYAYVATSLVISILVLLLVIGAFLAVWIKYKRVQCYNNKNLKKKMDSIKVSCVNEVDSAKKLKLEMPETVSKDPAPSALTTMTPLSTRHPAEDATLEYAYDNPTLTPSPVFSSNQRHAPNITPTRPNNTSTNAPRTETSF